eukprot:1954840-Prymnesium_polylepis.1
MPHRGSILRCFSAAAGRNLSPAITRLRPRAHVGGRKCAIAPGLVAAFRPWGAWRPVRCSADVNIHTAGLPRPPMPKRKAAAPAEEVSPAPPSVPAR